LDGKELTDLVEDCGEHLRRRRALRHQRRDPAQRRLLFDQRLHILTAHGASPFDPAAVGSSSPSAAAARLRMDLASVSLALLGVNPFWSPSACFLIAR
jgi:hypothetical protein